MNRASRENLRQDLLPLFINRAYIENWLASWHESYLRLHEGYGINVSYIIGGGKSVQIHQHFQTDNFSFTYTYNTEDGKFIRIRYIMSDYWITLWEGNLPIEADKNYRR